MTAISTAPPIVRHQPSLVTGAELWFRTLPQLAPVAAVIWVPYQLIQALLFAAFGVAGSAAAIDAAGARVAANQGIDAGSLAGSAARLAAYAVISLVLAVIALSLAQAALSRVADGALAGQRVPLASALKAAISRLPAVASTNVLIGLLIVAVELLVAVVFAIVSFLAGFAGLAALATGLGALALVLAPLVAFARVATAPQAAALDGCGPVEALRRAAAALRGHFVAALLIVAVTGAVAWLGGFVVQAVIARMVGGGGSVAGAVAAAVAAIVLGPLPQVALTVLHRDTPPRAAGFPDPTAAPT